MKTLVRGFLLTLALCESSAIPLSAAGELPHYKLYVGQDFSYSGSDEFKYQNGKFIYETKWRIWVVRQNGDGSWTGHHCITGRTFCTAAALLVLMADRAPVPVASQIKHG